MLVYGERSLAILSKQLGITTIDAMNGNEAFEMLAVLAEKISTSCLELRSHFSNPAQC